jgi:hypothetical protein
VIVTPPTVTALWDTLAREVEVLFELSIVKGTSHHQVITEQIAKVEEVSASLCKVFSGVDRRTDAAASLYDQVANLLDAALRVGIGRRRINFMPFSVKDLAARISYAARHPAMVQYTMLCDYVEGRSWPHRGGWQVSADEVAAHLSLAAAVAEEHGEAPRSWIGHVLSEEDRLTVRDVAAKVAVLEKSLGWFGHDVAGQRWAVVASGALDGLDRASTEIALGLLDGWDSSLYELLEAARRLN